MKTKTLLLFLIIFIASQCIISESASAQKKFRFFYGKVFDRVTRQPVSGVNFKVSKSNAGTVSDKKGEFSFYLDTIPSVLTISHVGYATKKIILDTATFKMTIYLVPVVTQLEEVVISAKPQETIFKSERYAILDYEFDSSYLYLLIYRNRFSRSELLCLTPGGDTIARSGLLPFTPRQVMKDCLGYVHVLGDDSAYQVFRHLDSLSLIYPVTVRKHNEILDNCVASTPSLLFFKKSTNAGLGTEFYTIDRKSNQKKWLGNVKDEMKIKMLKRTEGDAAMLMNPVQPDGNDEAVEWHWVRKIVYPPVKAFLYRIGEFICIFNVPGKQMEFFDLDGNYSYKLQILIGQNGDGRWTQEVLTDDYTLNAYTTFLKNGVISLYEVDLNTGTLSKKLSTYHYYPQKMRIYQNYLYYLYDDPALPDNKMLFRQRF